jgi:hypothetical protein
VSSFSKKISNTEKDGLLYLNDPLAFSIEPLSRAGPDLYVCVYVLYGRVRGVSTDLLGPGSERMTDSWLKVGISVGTEKSFRDRQDLNPDPQAHHSSTVPTELSERAIVRFQAYFTSGSPS